MRIRKYEYANSTVCAVAMSLGLLFSVWHGLCFITGSSHPVMVVSSESMEPALHRGDLILLWNRRENVNVGDIPVVWFPGRRLPMVHRAISVWNADTDNESGKPRQQILTKGDNCQFDDSFFYPVGQLYVRRDDIIGLVYGSIPYIGRITLALNENPALIYILVGLLMAMGVRG